MIINIHKDEVHHYNILKNSVDIFIDFCTWFPYIIYYQCNVITYKKILIHILIN